MKIKWADKLGNPECPYVIRWVFETKWFSVRLHHWINSDDKRHLHDHPWWYLTFILKGYYVELMEGHTELVDRFQYRFRPATHRHSVSINPDVGCWSLLITGPEIRQWGFWVKGKFRKRNKYFFEHGHHPCE